MNIDFAQMQETANERFKDGVGTTYIKAYADPRARILQGRLTPGSTIGMHVHDGTCEVIYVLSGKGRMLLKEGGEQPLAPGVCHYCPEGKGHSMVNDGTEDIIFFAVVPDYRPPRA